MSKMKKYLISVMMLIMCVGSFTACNDSNKYGVVLINNIEKYLDESFICENRTLGVYYLVDEYNADTGTWTKKVQYVEEGPATRDFIIDNEEKFFQVFNDFYCDINFEKEMLILHMYTGVNEPTVLKKVNVNNGNLSVTFQIKSEQTNINTGIAPGQICIAIKMNRIEINSIEFIRQ